MNPTGKFAPLIKSFRDLLEQFPDKRTGKNKRYRMEDAALSAFGVFFTQSPSFLAYQRTMAENKGRNNAQSLFGVHQIPSDNHIRDLLDKVPPTSVFPVFDEILTMLEQTGQLCGFRSFNDGLLVALDGTEYFGSTTIHCPHCSTRRLKNGETHYFHAAITPVIVCPGRSQVIPLVPEFIVPQDGNDKQDCENVAAKRWLDSHGKQYRRLEITVLGDDLYSHQPLCEQLLQQELNFILVCRPDSHKTLYEHLEGLSLPTQVRKRWTGKFEETYTYCYLNQVPLRESDDALLVNWCELTVTRSDGKQLYKNAFATNHLITLEEITKGKRPLRTNKTYEQSHGRNILKIV